MSGNASVDRLLHGFVGGMIGIGGLIIVAWAGLWVLGAVGGPQWQMPLKLLYSGGSLVLLALILRWLVKSRSDAGNH